MSDLYKYKVWCEDESIWVETDYRESSPTTCPNNNSHTITTSKTVSINTIPLDEKRAIDGKLMTHQTPRKRGTKTVFMGVDDQASNALLIGSGDNEFKLHHEIGDALTHVIIAEANMVVELNESWLYSSTLTCLNARNDDISVEFIPRVVDYGYVGVNTEEFSGSGLNDLTSSGTYSGTSSKDYRVRIVSTSPDVFKWSDDGGETWGEDVGITGSIQELELDVNIAFNATTGHTLEDEWRIKAVKPDPPYRNWNNYLVVPDSLGAGYGSLIDVFNDVSSPHLITSFNNNKYGGLVYAPDKEDSSTGELKPPQGCFFDANFNTETGLYEDITPNLTATGRFSMFTYPITLPGTNFIQKMPLLGNVIRYLGSHDIEQIGHGVRMVVTINTKSPDHDWWCCFDISVFRKRI